MGDADLTRSIIDAIILRCLYHLILIWCATLKYQFKGGFDDNLVLKINKDEFVSDISMISEIKDFFAIDLILSYLTYPKNEVNADAGTQPIFEFNNELFIPCIHIIESNIERNLLTLYARKDSRDFDRKSYIFEESMINDIVQYTKKFNTYSQLKRKFNKIEEEFDLILIDEINNFILIGELRWMIQPSDPREVKNKLLACREKLVKSKKKKLFFERNKLEIAKSIGVKNIEDYEVGSIIIVDGFSGEFSGDKNIPLVTKNIFNIALRSQENLRKIFEGLKSLEWLPKKKSYFDEDNFNILVDGNEYVIPGIRVLNRNSRKYIDEVEKFFKNI